MEAEQDSTRDERAKVASLIEKMNALEWEQLVGPYTLNLEFHAPEKLLQFLQCSELADSRRWVFRGQADAGWRLTPVIERLAPEPGFWNSAEVRVLRDFKERAHLYMRTLPANDDELSWARTHEAPRSADPAPRLDQVSIRCGLFRGERCG